MAENEFGLVSNAELSSADATATVAKAAAREANKDPSDTARLDGKPVTDKELRKEFGLNDPDDNETDEREPEKEVEVPTEDEDKDESDEDAPEGEGGESEEPIDEWLQELDVDTRQEILDEFFESNAEDLLITIRQGGEDVDMTLAELKRAASGYSGERNVEARIASEKADLKRREEAVQEREQFFAKQFEDPQKLLTFLDANVEDSEAYFKTVKEFAEAVLEEAEANPAQFRRNAALRRENAELREHLAAIRKHLEGNGRRDTTDEEVEAIAETPMEIEGRRRRKKVSDAGYQVDDVHKAWLAAGEPHQFDRWFRKWSKTHPLPSEDGQKKGRKPPTIAEQRNRRRGGPALRRRGPANPHGPKEKPLKGYVPDTDEIESFLRNHPDNKGRLT